jgi:YHS domain-containing protein
MTRKDPVCGMSVDETTAKHRADYKGEAHFFCGSFCLDQFQRDSPKYLAVAYHPSMLRLFARFVADRVRSLGSRRPS